jgi:hypothetical protein
LILKFIIYHSFIVFIMGLQQSTAVSETTLTVDDCLYTSPEVCNNGCDDQMAYSLVSGTVAFGMLLLQYHPGYSVIGVGEKASWKRYIMLGWNALAAFAIPLVLFIWTWVNYWRLNAVTGKASIPLSITSLCLAYMLINVSASWLEMARGKDAMEKVGRYGSSSGDIIAAFHYAIHIGLIALASGWGYMLNSGLQAVPDFTTGHLALFRQLLLSSGIMLIVTLATQATMNFLREDVVSFKISNYLMGGRAEGLKGMMPILYMTKLQAYAIMFFWLAFAVVYYNDQFQVASFAIGVVILAGAFMTIAFHPHYFSTYIIHALFWWFIIAYFIGPINPTDACYIFPLLLPSPTADYSTCDASFTLLCALSTAVSAMATVNVFMDKTGVNVKRLIFGENVQVVDGGGGEGVNAKLLQKIPALQG